MDLYDDSDIAEEEVEEEENRADIYLSQVTSLARELQRLRTQQGHGSITSVYLHLDDHWDWAHAGTELGDFANFVREIIRILPAISVFEICREDNTNRRSRMVVLPVIVARALCGAVHACRRNLTSLRFYCVKIMGNSEDFRDLAKSIRKITSLEKLFFDKVSLVGETQNNSPTTSFDSVVRAVAILPRLRHLRILGCFGHNMVLQNSTIRALCQSSSLVSLCLIDANLTNDNITQMAWQLETNQNLKELDIDCRLGVGSSKAFAKMMETNSVMEDLNLHVRDWEEIRDPNLRAVNWEENEDDDDDEGNVTSPTEKRLLEEDTVNEFLAQGIGKSMLKKFALFRSRISSKSQAVLRRMMSEQYFLESLTLYTIDQSTNKALAEDEHINFFCKLNYHGRRQLLLGEPPQRQWCSTPLPVSPEQALVDTLGRISNDLSCLFYFLSIRPSICDRALQEMVKEGTRKRRADTSELRNATSEGANSTAENLSCLKKRRRILDEGDGDAEDDDNGDE